MNMAKFLKALISAGIVAACVGMLPACSSPTSTSAGGAVAATVDGVEISEETVASTVQSVREQSALEDEESWANFLISNDMTPSSVREQIINSLVDQELVKKGAESLGINVESSEIDTYVDSMKANFDSDEKWADALKQAGFTEEEYRENIESSLVKQKLSSHFQEEVKLSDEELLESAQDYASYYDGAKRSSHILIGVEDTTDEAAMNEAREKAQALLDQINDGADFAKLAKENSTDTASAENGGDVGWDVLNSFVSEYTEALDELDKGEVSDLVETQYGIHIIKVTDVFEAPKKLKKIADLPEEFQSTITDMAKSVKANDDYSTWLEEQRKAADIVINDLPEDAAYNVDLSKYQDESASSASADAADDESASSESADAGDESAAGDDAQELDVEVSDDDDDVDDEDVEVIDLGEEATDEAADDSAADDAGDATDDQKSA